MSSGSLKALIVSSSQDEAITECLHNNQHYFLNGIDFLLIDDLLKKGCIYDHLDNQGTSIEWTLPGAPPLSNNSHYLINRIVSLPGNSFTEFIAQDQEYAQREYEAYLGFALNAFKQHSNTTVCGACEPLYSLPQQWVMVQEKTAIVVPQFYWGPAPFCDLDIKGGLVYSDIYDFYNWRINEPITTQESLFCFLRPPGEAVFVCGIGGQFLFSSAINLTVSMKAHLTHVVNQIKGVFNYHIFELLFFFDGVQLVFACINNQVVQLATHPQFERFVCNSIIMENQYDTTKNIH